MAKEKGKNERLESSASYEDLNGDKEVENPKARVMKDKRGRRWSYTIRQAEEAGVIAEWREINRKLRYHGYQPVMVLPCSQLQQIPRGAVVLEELTSKNLRQTLSKLMTDCDRRQSMVQQLITSSHRIQKDADEERNRVYHYEMKIRNLQKEVDEENLKTQAQLNFTSDFQSQDDPNLTFSELERMRLVELQNHGEEVKELKRSMSEVVALHRQLEQKVAQKEAEITRLQQQCQDLTEMSAGKQLKDSKKLIKLLESENTCLKMELESRPNHEEWKNSRKYNREFEKRLAQNNLSPPRQKHKDKRSVKTEGCASRQRGYTTQVDGIDSLPIDVCRSYLKEVCGGLQVIDLKDILDKIHIMKLSLQSYPAMERLIKDIIDVVNSEDAPRLTTEVLSENTHEFHCEMAWLNIVPVLRMWLRELSGLKGS